MTNGAKLLVVCSFGMVGSALAGYWEVGGLFAVGFWAGLVWGLAEKPDED